MESVLQRYQQIAGYLQDQQALKTITTLIKQASSKTFFIPAVGQFSAGKSHLFNNLLGRKILPTRTVETTAFVTYIQFAKEELAVVETADGSRIEFSLEQLLSLSQDQDDDMKSFFDTLKIKEEEVKAIHVYLNNELLKNGLVLIDTPGVNTLISRHENHTHSLLPQAQAVLYVLGKSITETDLVFIEQIHRMGTEIIFVRTKLDEIKKTENETVQSVIEKDLQTLQSRLNQSVQYFGITNEETLLSDAEWYERFLQFKFYIADDFAEDLDKKRKESIERKLRLLSNSLITQLEQRKQQKQQMEQVTLEELENQIKQLNREIEGLISNSKNAQRKTQASFSIVKSEIFERGQDIFDRGPNKFKSGLADLHTIDSLEIEGEQLARKLVQESTAELNDIVTRSLDRFLQSTTDESNQLLENINEQLSLNGKARISLKVEAPSIQDVFDDADYVSKRIEEQLKAYQPDAYYEQEMDLQQKRTELLEQIQAVRNQSHTAERHLSELDPYIPQYKESVSTQNAETLGQIGQILDWALVFMPSKAPVTIAKSLNASKTAITAVQQVSKLDKVKDALYMVKNVQEKARKGEIAKGVPTPPGILDMITVEYWFKQFGRMLDGPPQMVEDSTHRIEYERRQQQLKAKYDTIRQEELRSLEQMRLLDSREAKIKKEIELQQKYKKQLEEELAKERSKEQKEALQRQVLLYRKQLVQHFEKELKSIYQQQEQFLETFLRQFLEQLPVSMSMRIQEKLRALKQQLEQVMKEKENVEKLNMESFKEMDEHLAWLKNASLIQV